jgi:ABC-type sugar transport system substrate-binding protein
MEGKIGFFVTSLIGYHRRVVDDARLAADSEGLEMEVFDAHNTAVQQAQDLVAFGYRNAGKRLCAFVVPESDARESGDTQQDPIMQQARRLLQKGIGYVLLNHGREPLAHALRSEFPQLPVGMVAVDDTEFGRVHGRQVRALLPRAHGTVLCVLGNPFDSACRDRSHGLKQELQGSGLTLEELDGRWEESNAEAAVQRWVSSPLRRDKPLDAVVAQNDQMGHGARKALIRAAETLGRPDLRSVPVLGGDGLPDIGLPWVEQGILTATVCVTLPGAIALQHVARYWRDGTPFPAVVRLPVTSFPSLADLAARA